MNGLFSRGVNSMPLMQLEELELISGVFNKRGQVFRIGIGRCVTADEIRKYGKDLESLRDFLRASVYDVV